MEYYICIYIYIYNIRYSIYIYLEREREKRKKKKKGERMMYIIEMHIIQCLMVIICENNEVQVKTYKTLGLRFEVVVMLALLLK
jgi:hypothetical protein